MSGWRGVLLAAGLTLPALALGAQTWPVDPAQSQATFSVRKFIFAHARGTFPNLTGKLQRISTGIGADLGEVDATIDVEQLAMDDADDRAKALGPAFFDAAHFPRASFHSDPFPLSELVTGGTLRGLLDLHGETHAVAFKLAPSACPRQPLRCVIRVEGKLDRSDFGMHGWRAVLGDVVRLDLRIRLANADP